MTLLNQITPGWFATYGTTIRAGRDIDDTDTQGEHFRSRWSTRPMCAVLTQPEPDRRNG